MSATYTFDVYATLDGFGSYDEHGDWGGYWGKQGPELLAHRRAVYEADQTLVLGATTFRQFAEMIGPKAGNDHLLDPANTAMRAIPALVFSRTLEGPLDWPQVEVRRSDAVEIVTRLKAESAKPLRSHGSLSLNRALMAAGLVDFVQLTIFPALSGRTGTDRVFAGFDDFDLDLLESRIFDGRTLELIYRPTLRARRQD